jgi:hypothetical protein
MKRKIFTTAALICCFMICFAAIADLSGKWTGTIATPDGTPIPFTYLFKIDGNKLTGTLTAEGVDLPIDSGKINGNDFTFRVTDPQGVVMPHSGRYYGDSVSMNIVINEYKFHSTLKRTDK